MSFGPNKPKQDYKSLWSSYSGWLREAKSTFNKSSSTARAKAAASGIIGRSSEVAQRAQERTFKEEMATLRKGTTAKELKKFGARAFKDRREYDPTTERNTYRTIPAQFSTDAPDYEEFADIFKQQTGAEPEPWEVYFTKRYGFSDFKISKKDRKRFEEEEAAGKRALGAVLNQESQTSSPWV